MPKKSGRPKLPKNKVFSPGISIRLPANERKIINAAIKHSGLSQSEWVRKSLLYSAAHGINLA